MDGEYRSVLFEHLQNWTIQAGQMIRTELYLPLTIDTKSSPNDLVTDMDRKVESFFVDKIKLHYPNHMILGEEGYGDQILDKSGTIWIIDPIDGTMNFVNQRKNFAISIGIYHDGIGEIGIVYDVMNDILYSGIKGQGAFKNEEKLAPLNHKRKLSDAIISLNHHWLIPNRFVYEDKIHKLIKDVRGSRSIGSAALELMHVAEGAIDAYITMRLAPWDFAAGRVIVEEVGGRLTDIKGQPLNFLNNNSVVASQPYISSEIINDYLMPAVK